MTEGIIAGVVAALIWAFLDTGRRMWLNHRWLAHLGGRYAIRSKLDLQSDLGNAHLLAFESRDRLGGDV